MEAQTGWSCDDQRSCAAEHRAIVLNEALVMANADMAVEVVGAVVRSAFGKTCFRNSHPKMRTEDQPGNKI